MKKLLLLHGWGMPPATWAGMMKPIRNIEVLAPALPGYGDTQLPHPYSLENLADALLAEQTAPVALCGWSLGAMLAMCAAVRYPDKVSHLILIGATPSFVQRPDWPDAIDPNLVDTIADALRRDVKTGLRRFVLLLNQNDIRGSAIARELSGLLLSETLPPEQVLLEGLELLRQVDLRSVVSAIRQPVLIIHGARDTLMPVSAAKWLEQAVVDAKLAVFADVAHAPHLSDPERCAGLITDFLAASSTHAT